MDATFPFLMIVAFIGLGLFIRLLAGGADHGRIERYVAERGGRLISCEWAPFGKGWIGEKSDRIYRVRYQDADGNDHEASCKTSLFSGVYFTEDRLTSRLRPKSPVAPSRVAMLEAENRRLREELSRNKSSSQDLSR